MGESVRRFCQSLSREIVRTNFRSGIKTVSEITSKPVSRKSSPGVWRRPSANVSQPYARPRHVDVFNKSVRLLENSSANSNFDNANALQVYVFFINLWWRNALLNVFTIYHLLVEKRRRKINNEFSIIPFLGERKRLVTFSLDVSRFLQFSQS